MTGFDDPFFAEQALEAGAQDHLVKGDASDRTVARSIRYAITRKHAEEERKVIADRLAYSLSAECERLDGELSLARTMQFDLLPRRERLDKCRKDYGLSVESFFEPSSDIGGDLWGCGDGEGGRAVFYTFDFSGHGVGAALNVFRLHALFGELEGRIADPARRWTISTARFIGCCRDFRRKYIKLRETSPRRGGFIFGPGAQGCPRLGISAVI